MIETHTSPIDRRIAIIGAGAMGGALINGLLHATDFTGNTISVSTRSAASAAAFADIGAVRAVAREHHADANQQAAHDAHLVILAVKPWQVHEVLREISGELAADTIVVSVAAGVTTGSMEALLPAGIAVLRAMPNTPAQLRLGVTGIAAGSAVSDAVIDVVRQVFCTVGEVIVVSEQQLDAVTAVSGSGPAYLFLYTELLAQAAKRLGFDERQAQLLATHTVIGAAELMRVSNQPPAELRRSVTSPNGTTERAIRVLQDANLGTILDRALAANIRRSRELAAE